MNEEQQQRTSAFDGDARRPLRRKRILLPTAAIGALALGAAAVELRETVGARTASEDGATGGADGSGGVAEAGLPEIAGEGGDEGGTHWGDLLPDLAVRERLAKKLADLRERAITPPPPPPDGPTDGGGGSGDPLEEGQTAALVELELPSMKTFVLRATVPVPPGTYPRPDGKQPFGVVDVDGHTYGAQAEIVSRYPAEDEGADVVEVIAVVNRAAGLSAGDTAAYRVVLAPHDPRPSPGSADVADLWTGPLGVPASVQELLDSPTAIAVRAFDCFGNAYVSHPLDGLDPMRLTKYGEHVAELRVFETMRPSPPVSGPSGTLPHFLSTHAYLQTRNGETVVGFDLRVSNGHSGSDPSTKYDDPLGEVYFERLEVLVPSGWSVVQDYDDPFVGEPYKAGLYRAFPIVAPNPDGSMHWIEWMGQFHRRLAICATGEESRAREYLTGGGVAFARPGTDPEDGHPYWSWWNEYTARWFPQRHVLPSLDYIGDGALEAELAGDLAMVEGHLTTGSGKGDYPVLAGVLGWAHPYGISYGGMTGGAEINLVDGIRTVAAASRSGYQVHRIVHRMQTDRQAFAMYDSNGEASSVESWLIENGAKDYVPFEMFVKPVPSYDPFGLADAPKFQVAHVEGTGLVPPYKDELDSFDPHDYQHFIRYTRTPKVLAWMENDSLAKDDLRLAAENFRLGYHQYWNAAGGYAQGTGLRYDMDFVAENPQKGFEFGRGESWGLDVVSAAYSTGEPEFRSRVRPWFDLVAQTVDAGQAACSGFVQAVVSPQFVDGKYRARQMIEQSITENALWGMVESVFRRADPAHQALTEAVLVDSLYASISDMAWFPGEKGPWMKAGVGPLDVSAAPWCSWTEMPADAWVPAYDTFQNWSSFAYGFELTLDPIFLEYASLQAGGADLLTQLEKNDTFNLYNTGALIALLQWLDGGI